MHRAHTETSRPDDGTHSELRRDPAEGDGDTGDRDLGDGAEDEPLGGDARPEGE